MQKTISIFNMAVNKGLPAPIPFRMKPKKRFFSFKGRKVLFYVLALLTLGYIVFSSKGAPADKGDSDYQLAAPNEFVGVGKGEAIDIVHKGKQFQDQEVKPEGHGETITLSKENSKPAKINLKDHVYDGPSHGREKG